jgi:tagatose-1,6-bisphosphate aldolase non-catalytic subunit AgaZ/GatZ
VPPKLRDYFAAWSKEVPGRTLAAVGPVSELVLRAALEVAAEERFPAVLIASRNQVDAEEFGSGYLMGGTTQEGLCSLVSEYARGLDVPVFIARDHGGPWQRDRELNERLPVDEAMDLGRRSFRHDIRAGFNFLHIDPTKCPHDHTRGDLVRWTLELMRFCEEVRAEEGKPEIEYEVGTDDIKGGLTSAEEFEGFLDELFEELSKEKLPRPTCVVGQTGTLTKMDRNVGRFDIESTRRLIEIASRYGLFFKEHNADYLPYGACVEHPRVGLAAANVAPEFGLVETDALLRYAELESRLLTEGRPSRLEEALARLTFETAPWVKWLTDDLKAKGREELERSEPARRQISRVTGHYVFPKPAVRAARASLARNLARECGGLDLEREILAAVKASIRRYAILFNLSGALDVPTS